VSPSGRRIRYQVLRIAVPRRGRALLLLQLAYDRDNLPAGQSQNQLEEAALLAVVNALPAGVRPVILADRGFGRAAFLAWLQEQGLDYVVRITAGTGLVTADGSRWRLGTEGLRPGEIRWAPSVRALRAALPGPSARPVDQRGPLLAATTACAAPSPSPAGG
jgi:hypothetical protein